MATQWKAAAPPVKVSTRARWSDEWQERADLWCEFLEFAASPSIGEAQLRWRFGHGANPGGDGARGDVDRIDVLDHYLRIEIDPDGENDTNAVPAWYGRIVESAEDRQGAEDGAYHGTQHFVCWSLESELDREPILTSVCLDAEGDEITIGRAVGFNLGAGRGHDHGHEATANRSTDPGSRGAYVFAESLEAADCALWSASQILDYLLTHHTPRAADGTKIIEWAMRLDDGLAYLEGFYPRMHVEGETVRKALDQLLDRRRGFGWRVEVADNKAYVVPFSQFVDEVRLPNGNVLDANSNQTDLDFDDWQQVQKSVVRESAVNRYDQVVARGNPVQAVFTVCSTLGHVARDWDDDDEAAYCAAASGEADYAALDLENKALRNQYFRTNFIGKAGERVERVYAWFQLGDGGDTPWDGNADDGELVYAGYASLPQEPSEIGTDKQKHVDFGGDLPTWIPGLRLERHLPLYEHADYSGTAIKDGTIPTKAADNEFMPPLVLLLLEDVDESGVKRYHPCHALSMAAQSEMVGDFGRGWSCSLRMRDDAPGFVLRVSGTTEQHVLAKDQFMPADNSDFITPEMMMDWRDNLVATICLPTDQAVEVRWPTDQELEDDFDLSGKPMRRLLIHVRDAYLDYVVPDTVVGVRDGILQKSTSGGVVRSDVERLASIARLGYEWYCRTRRALTLQYRGLRREVDLGAMIKNIGTGDVQDEINTVVTRVRYDLAAGRVTVQTEFGELDWKDL